MKKALFLIGAVVALLMSGLGVVLAQDHGDGHGGMVMPVNLPTVGPDVTIRFAANVGSAPAACGMIYTGQGAEGSTLSLNDYRFYVSNVRLMNAAGEEVPVELAQDGLWQYANVALLDFEDGSGLCGDIGNADLNNKVVGTVPEGDYTGLVFDLGLPFELNHLDTTSAPAPLNIPAMWWNWQYGYKFVRIDMQTTNSDSPAWFIHLGSTGCNSADGNTPPDEPCSNPNVATVRFDTFNPVQNFVVADLSALLAGVDLNANVPMPPGCMSGPDDPDCTGLFPGFGLNLATGVVDAELAQTFFRVEGVSAPAHGVMGHGDADHSAMAHGHGDMAHGSVEQGDMSDEEFITMQQKNAFETPDNPLTVEPIVVMGDYAVAGWVQGELGGRVFWQRVDGVWTAVFCSGPSLTEASTLVERGVPQAEAEALVAAVVAAEAELPAEIVALFDSFEGTVELDGAGLAGHGEMNH